MRVEVQEGQDRALGPRERRREKSCPPHGPHAVHVAEGGHYVARCLACGLVGPEIPLCPFPDLGMSDDRGPGGNLQPRTALRAAGAGPSLGRRETAGDRPPVFRTRDRISATTRLLTMH
jgi:hypothetical protein